MSLQPSKINSNLPLDKQIKLAERNDQDIFRSLNQMKERIKKVEAITESVSKINTYVKSHHLRHEPGGSDEIGALAVGEMDDNPDPEDGRAILYRLKSDPLSLRVMTEDGSIRVIAISEPIN